HRVRPFGMLSGMGTHAKHELRDLRGRAVDPHASFESLSWEISELHKDLLAFQEQTEQRFEKVETDIEDLRGEIRSVREDVRSVREEVRTLRKDMPGIVADALRETLAERHSKRETD